MQEHDEHDHSGNAPGDLVIITIPVMNTQSDTVTHHDSAEPDAAIQEEYTQVASV